MVYLTRSQVQKELLWGCWEQSSHVLRVFGCTSGLGPPVGRPGLATETALRNHRSEVCLGHLGSAGKESD